MTVQQIINIANASSIYASNELSSGKIHSGSVNENDPYIIHLVRQGVEWLYDIDPTFEDLVPDSNYLLSLCKHSNKAEANITGGGSPTPVTSPTAPEHYDFVVGATATATAPIKDGDTSVILTRFRGYKLFVVRGGIPQSEINDGITACYSWNKETTEFLIINAPASTGEPWLIYPSL